MFDVFISYSRKDYADENNQVIPGNVVSKVKDALTAAGITFWFDEEGIYHGDSFAPIIAKNIKAARIFLFISSENSNKSMWTSAEIATAHAYKKKIIPFKYDDSVYHESVILYIAPLDYVEYFKNPAKAMARLIESIKSYLSQVEKEESRIREELENRARQEQEKKQREEELRKLRDQMSSVRTKREGLLNRIVETESIVSSLKLELSSLDDAYKDLQRKEASLLDNGFDERMVSVFSGKTDVRAKEKKEERPIIIEKEKKNSAISRFFKGVQKDWQSMPKLFRPWFVISMLGMAICWMGSISAINNGGLLSDTVRFISVFIIPLAVLGILRFNHRQYLGAAEMLLSCFAVSFLRNYSFSGWNSFYGRYGFILFAIVLVWFLLPLFRQNKKTLYRSFTFFGDCLWSIWKSSLLYVVLIIFILATPFLFYLAVHIL